MTRKDFFKSLAGLACLPVVLKKKPEINISKADDQTIYFDKKPSKSDYCQLARNESGINYSILVYWEKYDSDTIKVKFFNKNGFYESYECVILNKSLSMPENTSTVGFICYKFRGQASFNNNPFLWCGGWVIPDSIIIKPHNYNRGEYFGGIVKFNDDDTMDVLI